VVDDGGEQSPVAAGGFAVLGGLRRVRLLDTPICARSGESAPDMSRVTDMPANERLVDRRPGGDLGSTSGPSRSPTLSDRPPLVQSGSCRRLDSTASCSPGTTSPRRAPLAP
jgi:hypothetical protein